MELRYFIKKLLLLTKQEIITGRFDQAYELIKAEKASDDIPEYTAALMRAGVQPEKYLKEIPVLYMAFYSDPSLDLVLPDKITAIQAYAFKSTKLNSITIQNPSALIGKQAFGTFEGKIICSAEVKKSIEENCNKLDNIEFEVV